MKIKAVELKNFVWDGKDRLISDGNNLYLNIRKVSKTWIVRQKVGGKNIVTTIGKYPAISLKAARNEAAIITGRTPSSHKMSELVDKYIYEAMPEKSKKHGTQFTYTNHIIETMGKRKVQDIRQDFLVSIIQRYAKRAPRSADMFRITLNQVFGYGIELGWLNESPTARITKRITGYKYKPRERVLTDREIKELWHSGHSFTPIVRFLLLTGVRLSEANNGYINADKWRIDDTKNGSAHWVHLTETAQELLPLKSFTKQNIALWLKRYLESDKTTTDPDERYTLHDIRRSYATIAHRNGVDTFIVERVLNHKLPGIMSVYNRAEYEQERIECAEVVEKAILEMVL